MLRRKDVNIGRKQLFNIILISSLITVMPNMVEKAIRLSLFRQAKGKQLLSNIPDAGMLDHLQTRPWGVSPGWFTRENVFLFAGTSGWSCWGQPAIAAFLPASESFSWYVFPFINSAPSHLLWITWSLSGYLSWPPTPQNCLGNYLAGLFFF